MLHELREEMANVFAYSLHETDSHEVKAFLAYERTLYASRQPSELTFLKKTEEQGELYNLVRWNNSDAWLPKPFIFSLRPTESKAHPSRTAGRFHNLVLYDNAGEAFEYLKEREQVCHATHHLGTSDAILFKEVVGTGLCAPFTSVSHPPVNTMGQRCAQPFEGFAHSRKPRLGYSYQEAGISFTPPRQRSTTNVWNHSSFKSA
jgi:hypothetical protein